MEWTKERHEAEKAEHARQGDEGIDAQSAWETLGKALAEIERLQRQVDNAGNEAMHAQDELADLSERPPADASLDARAKIAMLAHDASPPAVFGGPWENAAPECHAAWIAVVRAVDASRPGLTEEQALATAGPLSRDIYNRIGLATGNKIGAPEWMRDAIAAALLRASRGALASGDVVISRTILERVAKAAASDPDAREARWAAERILQQTDLAAEPARTDPEAARRLAERHFLIIGHALGEVIGCTSSRGMPSPREVGEPGATFREVSAEACPLCAVVGGAPSRSPVPRFDVRHDIDGNEAPYDAEELIVIEPNRGAK